MTTRSRTVRFAVIGCGRMGLTADERASQWAIRDAWMPLSYASAISSTEGASLCAVCDTSEAALHRARESYPGVPGFLSLDEAIERCKPDVVAVATRTPDRTGILLRAADAGIRAVLCEKPLANSLEDADRVQRRFADTGTALVLGTRRRFMPSYRRARDIVASGEIGELRCLILNFGSGTLLWSHPHTVDLACFFASDSRPEFVQASLDIGQETVMGTLVDSDPAVRSAYIRFRNGISASISEGTGLDVELHGTEGVVSVLRDGWNVTVRCRSAGPLQDLGWFLSGRDEPVSLAKSGTAESIESIVRYVHEGIPPAYDAARAQVNTEILLGFVESELRGGARVNLPLVRRGLTVTGRQGSLFA